MNLIDTISLAGTLVLALPIAMLGVEFLAGGRTLEGVGFLAVAAGLLVGQHYIGTPSLKKRLAGTAMERFLGEDEQAEADDEPSDDDSEPTSEELPGGYR